MMALGYPGDLLLRWFWWALAMVPFCFVVSSCPGAPGKNLNNVLSGLKHLRLRKCVGQPLVNVVDWTVSGDAGEEPEAV